jgi:hypothetical protein
MAENDEGHAGQAGYNSIAKIRKKVEKFHNEAINRSHTLCTFSKDARFCENMKLPFSPGLGNGCMCHEHQSVPRYLLARFTTSRRAEAYAREKRIEGHNANVWQNFYVIIGPTAEPTNIFAHPDIKGGFIESMMYEDVLMCAIREYNIKLGHIVGRVAT